MGQASTDQIPDHVESPKGRRRLLYPVESALPAHLERVVRAARTERAL